MMEIWFDLKAIDFYYLHQPPAYFTNNLIWLHKYIKIYNIMENKKSE